ncbi:hypothetical protein CEXT_379391 [Caerostris extrusa]|uniref:Uncharacterized protein n=1 Tax=Caerostris extrusa TaxID=172846 RepID=A0AAV4YA75_CAEEX|nr:hypothetical protein CEXT_379391 [Caerostris extrusa]
MINHVGVEPKCHSQESRHRTTFLNSRSLLAEDLIGFYLVFAVIRCEMLRWYLMSNDMLISDWFNLNKSVKGTQTESLKDCDITSKRKRAESDSWNIQ